MNLDKIITANSGDDTLTIINKHPPYEKITVLLRDLEQEDGEKVFGHIKNNLGPCDLAINKEGELFIINSFDDTLLKIDYKDKKVNGIIKVGRAPSSLKIYDNKIYVVNCDSNSLTIVEEENLYIIENIYLGEKPTDIVIDDKNKKAYIANSNGFSISVLDMAKGKIHDIKLNTNPIKLIIDEGILFVLSYINNGVTDYSNLSAIETSSYNTLWTYKIKGIYLDFLKYGTDMNFYLTNPGDGFLYEFKQSDGNFKKIIHLGTMPSKISMDHEGYMYITDLLKDQIVIVDSLEHEISYSIRVGKEPQGLLLL